MLDDLEAAYIKYIGERKQYSNKELIKNKKQFRWLIRSFIIISKILSRTIEGIIAQVSTYLVFMILAIVLHIQVNNTESLIIMYIMTFIGVCKVGEALTSLAFIRLLRPKLEEVGITREISGKAYKMKSKIE